MFFPCTIYFFYNIMTISVSSTEFHKHTLCYTDIPCAVVQLAITSACCLLTNEKIDQFAGENHNHLWGYKECRRAAMVCISCLVCREFLCINNSRDFCIHKNTCLVIRDIHFIVRAWSSTMSPTRHAITCILISCLRFSVSKFYAQ